MAVGILAGGKLAGLIEMPVTVAEPLGMLQATNLPAGEDPYRHTVATGLALGALS